MKLMGMAMLWLLLSLSFSVPTHAQPWDWQLCDTCYRNYSYTYGSDSAFVLGAIGVSAHRVNILKDSLGVNLFLNYNGPTQIDTSTTGPVTEYINWVNATRRLLWQAAAAGIKVMYEPVNIQAIGKEGCGTLESYPALDLDSTHIFDFLNLSTEGLPDSTLWDRTDILGWRDTVTNDTPHLMASKPRFTEEGMKPDKLFSMYDAITPGTQIDSSNYVRFTFTATVDYASLNRDSNSLPGSTVIAYGIVYRRDTTDQSDTCICAHYRLMDTVKITRAMLNDEEREFAGDGFTNFHSRYYNLNEFPTLGHANNSQYCKDQAAVRLEGKTNTIEERDPRNGGNFYSGYVEGSDRAIYRFYTARRVPVQFLRASISQHSLELLKRGAYDAYIQADVDAVFDQPLLVNTYRDFMIIDEPDLTQFRAYGILSEKIQHYRNLKSPTNKRKLISYIYKDCAGLRSLSGDVDSGKYKLMQGMITDRYFNGGQSKLPIKYGNPDRLGYKARATWYRTEADSLKPNGDTAFWRMVFYRPGRRYFTLSQ